MPGTQTIYEYINDCSKYSRLEELTKVYPPNSTVILHLNCKVTFVVLGEVAKLVVDYNSRGSRIDLGDIWNQNSVTTQEVVIKSNDGAIFLANKLASLEVQSNNSYLSVEGDVTEHIDIKNNTVNSLYDMYFETCPDLWIDSQCGAINTYLSTCSEGWDSYINYTNC